MDFVFKYLNHHHTGLNCSCVAKVETQFKEVQACKIKLTNKCDEIQAQLLKDLNLFQ